MKKKIKLGDRAVCVGRFER